ncbi:MAG: CBS domain-containing protein [Planctomycetota bacterium]
MTVKKYLVQEYMHSPALTISSEAGLDRALLIMRTQHIRHLPVVDDDRNLIGIISTRNLRMSMQEMEKGPGSADKGYYLPALTKVRSVMVSSVVKAHPEMSMVEAATIMYELKIGALPVVDADGKKILGIITETDMLQLLANLLKEKDL